ncbi:MAG: GatB/YqeY domain-containing protein [Microgenomates group bacterium]
MITPNLMKMIGDAMKAHDAVRVSTLRGLSAELKNAKINVYDPNASEQRELTEIEEIAVVRKEAKKRKEAIEMYTKANALEQAENEKAELAILSEFLPAEVTEEQMVQLVEESIAQLNAKGMQDMGKVIADVKSKNSGVDGAKVAELVKSRLSA